MQTRKVKDAKDLETGELVYLKSHAKATYMSDGRTVEDAVNQAGTGGGGGGITTELDPIFSASPAAKITDENISSWNNKVDKVDGKQLSTEDFTTALKNKLSGLNNYNDTAINQAVQSLQTQLNTLVSGNANDAINSFNEIIAFLDGVKDSQDLSSIIASIEQQIAAKMDKVTLASVATSGSYNDLKDKPTIPSAVTESTVSGWGFTKNKGTVTSVKINGATKTPNANGVVDLGTIEGGGGSSSGGSGAYAEVNHGTDDTTFELTPNTFHVWDEVVELDLSFGDEQVGVANEYLFQFTSGATATSLTLPDSIKWVNGSSPVIAENKIYQVSVLKGLASVLEFNNVKIITFTFNNMTYQAEEGMSWADYIVSKYNDGTFYTSGAQINTNYGFLYVNGNPVGSSDVIRANGDYYAEQVSGGA